MEELEKIVQSGFDMDTLGIKEKCMSHGLGKNFRKDKCDWTPKELEVDEKMIIDLVPQTPGNPSHYTCKVPWKNEIPALQNNLNQVLARQRATNSERYLSKKGTTIDEIDAKFSDQLAKGYIEEVTNVDDINRPDAYYINYFPVVDKTRDTTKVRIVFDAAAKDKFGKSLNSEIEKGPNRLQDLFQIMLMFRMYEFGVTADISEMFLRVRLVDSDKKYHRFWWNGKIYQWTRILFGNISSPDISQKVLEFNAMTNEEIYQLACDTIKRFTYMDDTIRSLQTEKECVELVKQLTPLLLKVDMRIQKFYSNCTPALETLSKDLVSAKVTFEEKDIVVEASKVLGMIWDASKDVFRYTAKFKSAAEFFEKLGLKGDVAWTKRLILKLSATAYDPLGLLAPFTVRSRSIIQALWQEKLDWDTPIPESFNALWNQWLNELFQLPSLIEIPRWIKLSSNYKVQLHVFVDASTKVFAACVYARVIELDTSRGVSGVCETSKKSRGVSKLSKPDETLIEDGRVVDVSLVTAKARVTPTKSETVSRLELASCVIGVRLGHAVALAYDVDTDKIQYWTDSKNCLFWLNQPSSLLKVYVAGRVGEIQTHSIIAHWRHVPTELNPADIPTRAPSVAELSENRAWWKGPEFLLLDESEWPARFIPPDYNNNEESRIEFRKSINFVTLDCNQSSRTGFLSVERYEVGKYFNGFKFLVKNTALILSYVSRKLTKPQLFRKALEFQIRRAQRDDTTLEDVMDDLRNDPRSRKVYLSLAPFIDGSGILRSKSRLTQIESLPYDTKFPIILTAKSPFTRLLVKSYHYEFEHTVGIETAKLKLKDMFHIIGLENLLRSLRKNCLVCKVNRAKTISQQMSDIPSYRFEAPLRAFAKTGLDFAGPFEIKVGRGQRRPKVYILVLTCLQTRALHLEVTENMDTEAVINAISRFIDVRGMPTDILSDNWGSFVTEDKELENWVRHLETDSIITPTKSQITWHFTPPKGPHHGGIYEIMVKCTKRALKSLCHYPDVNMDQFRTFVSRCAALINGRPLTRTTVDGVNQILTPNHFLLGSLGGAIETDTHSTEKRWHVIHSLLNRFWKQFFTEYIPELKRMRKWKVLKPDVEVGELVLVLDPSQARGMWKLAVVEEVFKSKTDGLVRRCLVRTSTSTYERPITQLCPLDIQTKI